MEGILSEGLWFRGGFVTQQPFGPSLGHNWCSSARECQRVCFKVLCLSCSASVPEGTVGRLIPAQTPGRRRRAERRRPRSCDLPQELWSELRRRAETVLTKTERTSVFSLFGFGHFSLSPSFKLSARLKLRNKSLREPSANAAFPLKRGALARCYGRYYQRIMSDRVVIRNI